MYTFMHIPRSLIYAYIHAYAFEKVINVLLVIIGNWNVVSTYVCMHMHLERLSIYYEFIVVNWNDV